jgi:hypothetical protein
LTFQNFEKSQRRLATDTTPMAKRQAAQVPSTLPLLDCTLNNARSKKKKKKKSALTQYPRNFAAAGAFNQVDSTIELDSIVETRLVEHSLRRTRKKYSWTFGQIDQLLRTDMFKPKVGVKVTAASKRLCSKNRSSRDLSTHYSI